MSEQQFQQTRRGGDEAIDEVTASTAPRAEGFDDLLDEIDELLQGDSHDYVRQFVQKGGQ